MQLPYLKESKMPRIAPEEPHMAEGGEPEMESEDIMDHISKEAVDAVHARDHQGFRSALAVLVSDMMDKMNSKDGI